jgi:hypothetical protein
MQDNHTALQGPGRHQPCQARSHNQNHPDQDYYQPVPPADIDNRMLPLDHYRWSVQDKHKRRVRLSLAACRCMSTQGRGHHLSNRPDNRTHTLAPDRRHTRRHRNRKILRLDPCREV